jgi:hypothetical protein
MWHSSWRFVGGAVAAAVACVAPAAAAVPAAAAPGAAADALAPLAAARTTAFSSLPPGAAAAVPAAAAPGAAADALAPLVAARTTAFSSLPPGAAPPRSEADSFVYLDNGVVRLGIDTSKGGSVGAFGPSGSADSFVNIHDFGRETQVSYYTGPAPYNPPGCNQPAPYAGFPYNPIGAGDYFGHPARLVSVAVAPDNASAVVTSVPAQWACDDVPAEGTLVKTITLVGAAAEVATSLALARPDTTVYPPFQQELPAVYVTGELCALWAYTGDAPFTGAPATQLVPPDPTHGVTLRVPEQWLAFTGPDPGAPGVGLWHPSSTVFAAMRWNSSFSGCVGGPYDDVTGYMSARFAEVLDADITYAYNYSLVWGSVDAIRGYAAGKAAAGASTPGLPFSFAADRDHFTAAGGANSTWPVVGFAHLPLPGPDPNWVSGFAWWDAESAPTLHVTAAYSPGQHDTTAQLFYQTAAMPPGFDADHVVTFSIIDDGDWHSYAVPMAGGNYSGVIVGLRFDPVVAGAPGAWVNVSCISAAPPAGPPGPGGC